MHELHVLAIIGALWTNPSLISSTNIKGMCFAIPEDEPREPPELSPQQLKPPDVFEPPAVLGNWGFKKLIPTWFEYQ